VRVAALAAALLVLALAPAANASEAFADVGPAFVSLEANRKGEALVTYKRADGRIRHVLVWGAVGARAPNEARRALRFKFDYAGGWGKHRRASYWRSFRNFCEPYDGPQLAYFVAGCRAPDGSLWALQAWQRLLPHRGYDPWLAWQSAPELRVSHFVKDIAQLEVHTDWAFNGDAHDLFGRLTYAGLPVHGFASASGNPRDRYGRNVYIDTYDSAYGSGWKRETSVLLRKNSGSFCYSFWPTRDKSLPGYPNNRRPAGHGKSYRITVPGPGATPDVVWEGPGLPDYNPGNPEHVALERRMNDLLWSYGDRFCRTQL
jgi:hypothetical protein